METLQHSIHNLREAEDVSTLGDVSRRHRDRLARRLCSQVVSKVSPVPRWYLDDGLTHGSFLKLCKVKYYNFSPIHTVQKGFSFQTGDPLGPESKESDGGSSIWGLLGGPAEKSYAADFNPKLKHVEKGTVSMATAPGSRDPEERVAGSQFLVTLGDNIDYLDGKAAIFGKVVEGFDALEKINDAFIDDKGQPLKDIRIRHTIILDDPFNDPIGLKAPQESPLPTKAQLATVRIADDEVLDENADEETVERLRREREARAQALTLEMVGDLPFAEVKPPENVLFVCKLNPVTQGLQPYSIGENPADNLQMRI